MTYPPAYEAMYAPTLVAPGNLVLHVGEGRALYAWAAGVLTRIDAGSPPPPVAGLLGWDEFTRTVTSGWGTADAGGDWVTTTGPTSVAGGAGLATLTGTQRNASARLPGAAGSSVQTRVRISLDKAGNGTGAFTLVRGRIVAGNEYRLKAQWSADLTMDVWLARSVGGVETQMGPTVSVPGGWDPGAPVSFVMETVSAGPTTLRGKVWTGDTEPGGWLLEGTDSTAGLQEAGHTGLYVQLGSSATDVPVVARFTDFEVIPSGSQPAPDPTFTGGLLDDFSGTSFDGAKWPTRTQPTLSTLTGGRARLTLGGSTSNVSSSGMTDLQTLTGAVDLRGSYVTVKVATVMANGANNREVGFMLTDAAGKFVSMFAANPNMSTALRYNTYGTNLNLTVALPPTELWWRIRHDGTNVLWESSADGQTWTMRRTEPAPNIDYSAMTLRLYAGFRGAAEPDVFAEFDAVWVGTWTGGTGVAEPDPETGLAGYLNYADPAIRATSYGPLVGFTGTAYNLEDAVQTFETPKDGPWETGNFVPQRGVIGRGADVPGAGQLWRPTAAARFEVRPGDEYASVMGDGSLYRTRRTEYRDRLGTSGTPFTRWPDPVGAETWYEFAYYLPPGFEFAGVNGRDGAMWSFITQFKTLGGSPPLAIEVKRQQLRLGGTQGGGRVIKNLNTNEWGRLRVGILTSVDPAVGWVEVHHNDGVPIPRTSMATTHLYNGQPAAHYLKQGLYEDYRWDTAPRDDGGTGVTHVAWLGPVRIARSLAALEG